VAYKVRRDTQLIVGIVVVGVASGINITEVVGIARIRTSFPVIYSNF
jgi:hypothetical protein